MPSRNRGKQPNDDKLFGPKWHPVFRRAVEEHGWLLGRGYAEKSVTQLVGNRYRLNARQRLAIQRVSASEADVATRRAKQVSFDDLRKKGQRMLIIETSGLDGFALTRRFYLKHGYEEEARIRDYYQKGEDKVVFRKVL